MTNATAYIKQVNIKEVQQKPKNKAGKDWWSIIDEDGEYYSATDPTIVARLTSGWNNLSIVDKPSGDKVFHNIVGIAPPTPITGSEDISAFLPGATPVTPTPPTGTVVEQTPAVAKPATPAPTQSPAPTPMQTNQLPSIYEVRARALEIACKAPGVTDKNLSKFRDAFYNYIVNGTPTEHKNSSKEDINEFIAQ